MNKTVMKVFLLIFVLVVVFIIWQLVFNDGGVIETGWNAIATVLNNRWANMVNDDTAKLLPTFDDAGATEEGSGFDIGTD